nr:78 kda glucose-regulated protein like [Quercus suber]
MARFSRDKSRPMRSTVSPWMTAFYICAILLAPMLFMGMIPSAHAQDTEPTKDNAVTGPVIGIDLGTTYSCVGIMKGGKVEILVNDQGNRITPSWVAWNDEERLVGDAAKNQFAANPERTIFDIKRLIGRKFDERDVQRDMKHFPFKVVNKGGQPRVKVDVSG